MVAQFLRVVAWAAAIGFVGYVILTHPSMAADAIHAALRGIVNAGNAFATFVDDLLSHAG